MNVRNQVKGGVKWTTVSTVFLAISSILKISILTRFLDKSDFGLVAIVTFILSFMELFNDMGISTAILHKQNISKDQYSSLYWVNLIISLILYLSLLGISPMICDFYDQPMLLSIIPLLGLNLIFTGFGRQFRVILQKNLNFKILSIVDIASAIISLVIALWMAYQGMGIYALVLSTVIQFFISNLFFLFFGLKKHKISFILRINKIKDFLKIGGYQVGGQIANYFNRDLDVLLIGKFFSPDVLGGYSLAKQLVFRPFQVINPIILKVASPALAKFQNDKNQLKTNYLSLLKIVSSLNIIVYLLLIVFAPIIIRILYGEDYQNIVSITQLLSVYMIFRSIGNPVGSLVVATGRTDLDLNWNLFTLLLSPLIIYLGSLSGINGVALSLIISMIVLFYPSWKYMISKMINISFGTYVKACFGLGGVKLLINILKRGK